MNAKLAPIIVSGLLALVLGSGCVAALVGGAAAGAGTVAYVRGELRSSENVTLDVAWTAALEAMKDLQMGMEMQKKDGLSGTLKAHMADNTKVHIKVSKTGPAETLVRIRVGTFGNQTWSRAILDQMKKHF